MSRHSGLSAGKIISDPYGAVRVAPSRHCRKDPMPVGTVVIRGDRDAAGRRRLTRYIKVRADGPSQKRWTQYSRWWWEKNNGSVPKGHLVLHKDGQTLNDAPENLMIGTCAMKFVLAHQRDATWSKSQHARAAAGTAKDNRRRGRVNRFWNFLKRHWYPVVDSVSVILNVPFRRRKRVLACFGADVSRYPRNGHGKKPGTRVQEAIKSCRVLPVRGSDFSRFQYSHYCSIDPETREVSGPMSGNAREIVAQLERMGVWSTAEKYAKKDLRERR
jgi:hypothetical protein